MFDLSEKHLSIVKTILRKYLEKEIVWVFGSRAKNNAREYSDLDLAIEDIAGKKIDFVMLCNLKSEFSESDLPWEVDLLDMNDIDKQFRLVIDSHKLKLDYA